MRELAAFPFPYFGHAYSEDAFVRCCVWFTEPPTDEARERITGELGELHAFSGPDSRRRDVTWSAEVVSYDTLVDQERKYLEKSTPRVRAALKSADLELYDVRPHAMRAVPFAMHLLVDQALLRIHQEVPISFAVRGCGSRDKPTAWHTWSLTQCTDTLARIRGFLEAAPRSYFPAEDGWAYIAPWLRATTHLVRACSAKPSLSKLDDSAKSSLRDVITLAIAHATLPTESRTSSAAAIAITEARGALVGLGEKLGQPKSVKGASAPELLDRIEKESQQFAFTRIRLSECPTFVAVRAAPVRFPLCVAATERQLRYLEASEAEQQALDVRERLIRQLLRGRGTFARGDAMAMLDALLTTSRPLGAWLPVELIASKIEEHVAAEGATPELSAALEQLLAKEDAITREEIRTAFERIVLLIRPESANGERHTEVEPSPSDHAPETGNDEEPPATSDAVVCSDVAALRRAARAGAASVTLREGRYELDIELELRQPLELRAEPGAVLVLARPSGRVVTCARKIELLGVRFEVHGAEVGPHAALVVTAGSATLKNCELVVEHQDGSVDQESIGLLVEGDANVTVEASRVFGFATGARAQSTAKLEARDCGFSRHAAAAVSAGDEAEVFILDSRIEGVDKAAITFEATALVRVERSVCTGGAGAGIEARGGKESLVRDCVFSGFGQAGVLIDLGRVVLQNSVVSGCGDGVVLQEGGKCELRGNVFWKNDRSGVHVRKVRGSCDWSASGDRAAMNGSNGFTIEHPAGLRAVRCSAYLNGSNGLHIEQARPLSRWAGARLFQSRENRSFANGGHGVSVGGYAEVRAEGDRLSRNGGAGMHVREDALAKVGDCDIEDNGGPGLVIDDRGGSHVSNSLVRGNGQGGIVALGANPPIVLGTSVTANGGPAVTLREAHRPAQGGRPKSIAGLPLKDIHYLPDGDSIEVADSIPAPGSARGAIKRVCMLSRIECRGPARVFLAARRNDTDPGTFFAAPLLANVVDGVIESIERSANAELLAALFPERKRRDANSRLKLGVEDLAREPYMVRGYRCDARFVDEGVYLAMLALATSTLADAWSDRQAVETTPLSTLLEGAHELSQQAYGAADTALARALRPDLVDLSFFLRAVEDGGFQAARSHPFVRALVGDLPP